MNIDIVQNITENDLEYLVYIYSGQDKWQLNDTQKQHWKLSKSGKMIYIVSNEYDYAIKDYPILKSFQVKKCFFGLKGDRKDYDIAF